MYDSDKRKLLSLLSHASIVLGSLWVFIGVPLVVLLVSDDPVVKENAKEALNFHINVLVYEVIIGVLWASIIGIPIAFVLGPIFVLFHWIPPIFALLQIFGNPDQPYRYPFIFRLV